MGSKNLKPFIATAPEYVVPLLVLDSCQCHMMASVIGLIQKLGVKVEHIYGGCTSLCQPVVAGINRSTKANIRKDWEDWMLDSEILVSMSKLLTRKLIVEWMMLACNTFQ